MELPMAMVIAVLFGGGTYLILRPNLIRIVMGFGLYSNAANLTMIACGGYSLQKAAPFSDGTAPALELAAQMMDPLPPDIILTAIVISFAVSALFLTISYRVFLDHGTDNPQQLPARDTDDADGGGFVVPDVLAEVARPDPNSPKEPSAAQRARH